MSAHDTPHDPEDHASFIKTPQQLVTIVVLAFVVPVVLIILLAKAVVSMRAPDPAVLAPEAVAMRIKPVADVAIQAGGGGAAAAPKSGEEIYKAVCAACHQTGVANAPKLGDKAAWAGHIKEGLEAMVKAAINGIRAMPPRGGNPNLSDLEVARAVAYMANAAGASFQEPAAPAAAAQERSGEQIVQGACGNCHLTGEGGAPKVGDKAAWSQRIARGLDAVTLSAIRGHGGMPARGGFADLTDAEVKKAIVHMFEAGGGKLVPAAAAPAPSAPAASAAPAAPAPGAAEGKAVYDRACIACHQAGVAGAPKFADKSAWVPRLAQGMDALYASSLKGKGAMPPKGGQTALSDADVKAAVDYMVAAAK